LLSLQDCIELHKLPIFPANAAEKQHFYMQQMIKKPQQVCEDIPTGISLCCDSVFVHKKEFLFFNSLKGFWRSLEEISQLLQL
jgi:hypothetical protein